MAPMMRPMARADPGRPQKPRILSPDGPDSATACASACASVCLTASTLDLGEQLARRDDRMGLDPIRLHRRPPRQEALEPLDRAVLQAFGSLRRRGRSRARDVGPGALDLAERVAVDDLAQRDGRAGDRLVRVRVEDAAHDSARAIGGREGGAEDDGQDCGGPDGEFHDVLLS